MSGHPPDWYPTPSGADIFYPVAQHCVLMSRLASPENALIALLHDAGEAYCQDIMGPLKQLLRPLYEPIERMWLERISVELGVDLVDLPDEVKLLDKQMLLAERRDLLPPDDWTLPGVDPAPVTVYPWAHDTARMQFLVRFHQLTKEAS